MADRIDYYELLKRLATRYDHPRYAFFREIGNAVGFPTRRGDALAMAMWRSLGLEVHGFEIKCSRQDWLRERNRPDKAEDLYGYCDRWWLVVADPAILRAYEAPTTWGLLVPHGDGLITKVEAPKLKPKPLTREFVASILRQAFHAQKPANFRVVRTPIPKSEPEELEHMRRLASSSLSLFERRLSYLLEKLRDRQPEPEHA